MLDRPSVKLIMEAKSRNAMQDHEKAIGIHVAKNIIDLHHDMFADDYGRKATKPHDVGTVLNRAINDASQNVNDAGFDPHPHHQDHFDRISHHTKNHLRDVYNKHLMKHGVKGLPPKTGD